MTTVFKIRKRILLFGFSMLLLFFFLLNDIWAGLYAYALSVSLMDAFFTYLLKIKSSKHAVKKELLVEEGISPKAFDVYYKMITKVRVISLGISALIASLLLFGNYPYFQTFSLIYITSTLGGVFYLRYLSSIKKPVLVSIYELSPEEKKRLSEKKRDCSRPFSEELRYNPLYSNLSCNIYYTDRSKH